MMFRPDTIGQKEHRLIHKGETPAQPTPESAEANVDAKAPESMRGKKDVERSTRTRVENARKTLEKAGKRIPETGRVAFFRKIRERQAQAGKEARAEKAQLVRNNRQETWTNVERRGNNAMPGGTGAPGGAPEHSRLVYDPEQKEMIRQSAAQPPTPDRLPGQTPAAPDSGPSGNPPAPDTPAAAGKTESVTTFTMKPRGADTIQQATTLRDSQPEIVQQTTPQVATETAPANAEAATQPPVETFTMSSTAGPEAETGRLASARATPEQPKEQTSPEPRTEGERLLKGMNDAMKELREAKTDSARWEALFKCLGSALQYLTGALNGTNNQAIEKQAPAAQKTATSKPAERGTERPVERSVKTDLLKRAYAMQRTNGKETLSGTLLAMADGKNAESGKNVDLAANQSKTLDKLYGEISALRDRHTNLLAGFPTANEQQKTVLQAERRQITEAIAKKYEEYTRVQAAMHSSLAPMEQANKDTGETLAAARETQEMEQAVLPAIRRTLESLGKDMVPDASKLALRLEATESGDVGVAIEGLSPAGLEKFGQAGRIENGVVHVDQRVMEAGGILTAAKAIETSQPQREHPETPSRNPEDAARTIERDLKDALARVAPDPEKAMFLRNALGVERNADGTFAFVIDKGLAANSGIDGAKLDAVLKAHFPNLDLRTNRAASLPIEGNDLAKFYIQVNRTIGTANARPESRPPLATM